jgi:hypothetical protein
VQYRVGKTHCQDHQDPSKVIELYLIVAGCHWSSLNHGVADTMIKRLNLGNLNPIYEREFTKLELSILFLISLYLPTR